MAQSAAKTRTKTTAARASAAKITAARSKRGTAALLDHVVLEVRDPLETAEFYDKVLKFPPVRKKEFLAGDAPFISGRVNETTVIDYFPKPMWVNRRKAVNPNHFCLTMSEPEVTALKRRLSRHKVKITRRLPVSFGAQGWGDSIYFEDPNGVTVEVRYYGKDAKKKLSAAQQRAQSQQTAKMLDTARGKSARPAKGGRGKAKAKPAAKGGRGRS